MVANILAAPLKVLAPLLCAHVASGGHLLLAGILKRQTAQEALHERGLLIGVLQRLLPLLISKVQRLLCKLLLRCTHIRQCLEPRQLSAKLTLSQIAQLTSRCQLLLNTLHAIACTELA